MFKRILALIMVLVTIFLMVPVASADYQSTANSLWDYYWASQAVIGEDIPLLGKASDLIGFAFTDTVCNLSGDHFHHTDSLAGATRGTDDYGLYANVTCKYCGEPFKCYSSDLKQSYDQQVQSLPATGIDSDGYFRVSPDHDYIKVTHRTLVDWPAHYCSHSSSYSSPSYGSGQLGQVVYACDHSSVSIVPASGESSIHARLVAFYYKMTAPVSGIYTPLAGPGIFVSANDNGAIVPFRKDWVEYSGTSYNAGATISTFLSYDFCNDRPSDSTSSFDSNSNIILTSYSASCQAPVYKVQPLSGLIDFSTDTTYNIDTRVGNIGGNYSYTTDNSTHSFSGTIVNETNNTYNNPVTGTERPISNWSYDYGDRSYTLTFEGGDTSTVTYGDENLTISETTVNEGDTITNNYTIYYTIPQPDPEPSPSPSPSDPGGGGGGSGTGTPTGLSRVFKTYAAEITQAYGTDGHGGTDCIPSSGVADTIIAHSEGDVVWTQTGKGNDQGAEGDASYGNAIKIKHANGYYTLYAHLASVSVRTGDHVYRGQSIGVMGNTGNSYGAHLHFEVRDASDVRINSDPYLNADLPDLEGGGKSEDDLGLWEKLGHLLGTFLSGIITLLETVLSHILDALTSLVGMLVERLNVLVSEVMRIFEVIPTMFGGFLDLLGALFPYLPEEMLIILEFGLIAVVALAIIWAIRRK